MSGELVKAYRFACHMSQADLAEAIGVTRQRVIAIESGDMPLTRTIELAIAAHAAGLRSFEGTSEMLEDYRRARPRRIASLRAS